jgi:hypothetical protein
VWKDKAWVTPPALRMNGHIASLSAGDPAKRRRYEAVHLPEETIKKRKR